MSTKLLSKLDIKKVPFVPALDLLEKKNNLLTKEEAVSMALALFLSLDCGYAVKSAWRVNSYKETIANRL